MGFRFEKLNVWQDARRFVGEIYRVTNKFPQGEKFGLVDQLRRAAISIALNIAEGSDRKSDVDFRRFLRTSIGSINEVVTGLYLALDQDYLNQSNFDKLYEEANKLAARINALVSKVSRAVVSKQ